MSGQTFAHLAACWHRCLGRSGGTALLEEAHHWGQALRVYSLTPLPRILLWPLAALLTDCCGLSSRNKLLSPRVAFGHGVFSEQPNITLKTT